MPKFSWCKIHKVTSHGKCHICCPPAVIKVVDIFASNLPDYSKLPSIEAVLLIPKMDWEEKHWVAWRVWNASKNQ